MEKSKVQYALNEPPSKLKILSFSEEARKISFSIDGFEKTGSITLTIIETIKDNKRLFQGVVDKIPNIPYIHLKEEFPESPFLPDSKSLLNFFYFYFLNTFERAAAAQITIDETWLVVNPKTKTAKLKP